MKYINILKTYVNIVVGSCQNINHDNILKICDVFNSTNDVGGRIYICGNGGSASTASHFQNDLNMAFSLSKGTMPAICLADNLSMLTAISNDISYDDVYVHQLKFMLKPSDIFIAISCSGNSMNILKAAEFVKQRGNTIVSLVGFDGGKLKQLSNYSLHVNVNNMQISEDMHLMFCHMISTLIRERYTND
ncbi:SIS domain-containing protein [Selenomonas sp. AB3002]|uniref:SIS domain-containing protein n=1 Tax=Selenomonas sp. AB3002 TaxID=1392502 RepID=UPI0004974E87